MKRLAVLVTAVVSVWAAAALPSHAAGPYKIAGTSFALVDGGTRFKLAGCPAGLDDSPADGVDAQIVNLNRSGPLVITWTSDPTINSHVPGNLVARFFDSNCNSLGGSQTFSSTTPGAWSMTVPANTKWMVVVSTNEVNVQFSF